MSEAAAKLILCPYCGCTQPASDRCVDCGGLFEPLSRRATQIAMGPWFIRDKNNPFRPGCSYEVLKKQIRAGRIKPTTVIRGPTTRQFWSVARHVPGVAHLLGYCHRCGVKVNPDVLSCPSCLEPFREVAQRDELGLMFPTATDAGAAQRALDREIALFGSGSPAPTAETPPPATIGRAGAVGQSFATGVDLLDEVVGEVSARKRESKSRASGASGASGTSGASGGGGGQSRVKPSSEDAPPKPEALNFTPSDEASSSEPIRPLAGSPRRESRNLLIWVLIFIIIVVLILQIVSFLSLRKDDARESSLAPAESIPELLLPAPLAAAEPEPTSPLAPNLSVSVAPEPSPLQQEEAKPAAPEPEILPPPPPPSPVPQLLAAAKKLQQQSRYPEALAKLKEVAAVASPAERPLNLDQVMHAIEAEIARQKKTTFFGIPTR